MCRIDKFIIMRDPNNPCLFCNINESGLAHINDLAYANFIENEIELYILNKPKGYITSRKDELDRKTVYDLLPDNKQHLISIGRLDYNTEGLLLFTNNGDYARYYELPKNKISRTYKVKVYGNMQNSYIKKIKDGITKATGVKGWLVNKAIAAKSGLST